MYMTGIDCTLIPLTLMSASVHIDSKYLLAIFCNGPYNLTHRSMLSVTHAWLSASGSAGIPQYVLDGYTCSQ